MHVTKAVIPAAGFGTRFLPQTKAMPKVMLPIVDKPIIQIVVEELVDAGITDIIIVTGWHKRAIEDHFDSHPELESLLEKSGKNETLAEVKKINNLANFVYVRQKGPMGNATPLLSGSKLTNNEPFLVFWGDDFIVATPSRAKQLIKAYEKHKGVILGAIKTNNEEDTKKYGFAKGKEIGDGVIEVSEIVEKPGPGKAPSNLATVSGFLFTPEIVPYFERVVNNVVGREPNYIDAISEYMKDKKGKFYAVELKNAKYYDTGSKLGYLEAVVDFALRHKGVGREFREYLKRIVSVTL
jgi:UTP--glucose-1-phosphate uridylyltransferase